MSTLETRIAEWRRRMAQALPKNEEAVDELEEHLRERVAELESDGTSDDDAFAIAQAGLGEPHVIAREFDRIPGRWRPGLLSLPALALVMALFIGIEVWYWKKNLVTVLQVAAVFTPAVGFFGILGAGLIATDAFIKTSQRPLSERERHAVRGMLSKLGWLAGVCISTGWALNVLWLQQFFPLWPMHARFGCVFVSVALHILARSRTSASDRAYWVAASLPSLVLVWTTLGWRDDEHSVPWVCVAFLLVQVYFVRPRARIRIELVQRR